MKNKFKLHAPLLSVVLSLLAVGYSFAANVVVIPLAADTPSGMVSAFNSTECPAGWKKYTDAQGRFVVGLNDGGNVGYTSDTPLADKGIVKHNHRWAYWPEDANQWYTYDSSGGIEGMVDYTDGIGGGSGYFPMALSDISTAENYFTAKVNHTPPYIQLLFCEKV